MNPYYEQYVPGQNPTPFYQAYGRYPFCPFCPWEDEKARDQRKFRELYPALARQIQPLVEEECDRMEYDGSMMYDEYPDQLQLRMMCRRIYDRMAEEEGETGDWLMELIQVMTYHELCQRRCEYRNCRRRFY